MGSLVERLGHPADSRLLIITATGLGACHSMNEGVYRALREGLATTASVQVPCPWAREASARYRGEDVGIHLTLNSEYDLYRWGPVTYAPSLLDGDGGFPRTLHDVWEHADPDEVRRECRAQIERAVLWGYDPTHLSSHLHAMVLRPELLDIYLDLAAEFSLPVRLADSRLLEGAGFPVAEQARERGVVFADRVVTVPGGAATRHTLEKVLADLEPGVTEVHVRPAADFPELRSFAPDWSARVDDMNLLTSDSEFALLVRRSGAVLVGYRALRNLMRAG